jgi:hypothetical protein
MSEHPSRRDNTSAVFWRACDVCVAWQVESPLPVLLVVHEWHLRRGLVPWLSDDGSENDAVTL